MSGAGLIELLAARLGGRSVRRSAPALREVLASAMPNRAPVTAYEPIASRLDDPMAEGAMLSGTDDVSPPLPNAIRTGPDAGPVQGENGTTLYRGSATGGRRGRWLTPDGAAAADYGPVTSSVEDISRATPIRDFGDLELALGNRSGVLGRMDERNADVWDALDDPAVQQALRDEGHSAVRLMDDVSPTGRRHESYLVLNTRTAPDGRPVQAGRIPSSMRIEIQQPPGQSGSRYRLELDNQKNGFITVTDDGDVWRVNNSHLDPDLRNQGHGVRLYEDLVLRAREAGARTLRSDNSVSTEAQNAWMGLQRRGYPVTRIETPDGPRFEVDLARTGPNAGSDRNALQRALRDRMNRE